MWNYIRLAPLAALAATGCTAMNDNPRLFNVSEVTHRKVYESPVKPGHNQWPSSWVAANGDIYIAFQSVDGDRSQAPGYQYAEEEFRAGYDIRQNIMVSRDSGATWELEFQRETLPYHFFIPLRHPGKDGELIALCSSRLAASLGGTEEEAMVLAASADNGRTLRKKSEITYHEKLYPADIKSFGAGLIVSGYTQAGESVLFYSPDMGASWQPPVVIATPHDNMSFHEPALEVLDNQEVISVMRTHREDIPKHNGINYHQVVLQFADGNFQVKGELQDTGIGFRGRPQLLKTSDGILILTAPGGLLAFSGNRGDTYEIDLLTLRGIAPVLYLGGKPFRHNADPQLIQLHDGSIFCSYFIGSDYPFPAPVDEYIGVSRFRVAQ